MRFHCDDVQVHNEGLVKIIIYNRIKKEGFSIVTIQ